MSGFVKRMPSKRESKYAEDNDRKAYWPSVGRYWESNGKHYLSLNIIPDAVFMLSEDKPKEGQEKEKPATAAKDEDELY